MVHTACFSESVLDFITPDYQLLGYAYFRLEISSGPEITHSFIHVETTVMGFL